MIKEIQGIQRHCIENSSLELKRRVKKAYESVKSMHCTKCTMYEKHVCDFIWLKAWMCDTNENMNVVSCFVMNCELRAKCVYECYMCG